MPIIKDKYSAKGENIRSKFVKRKTNRAIYKDTIAPNMQTTEQKLSLQAQEVRSPGSTIYNTTTLNQTTALPARISGKKLSTANKVENILTLSEGESLKDIIISHYSASGASVISLHWSPYPISDLTFTVSSGIITAVSGGITYRLFSDTFEINSTLPLNSSNMFDSFNNISKTIYFYAVCSVTGPEITIVKC